MQVLHDAYVVKGATRACLCSQVADDAQLPAQQRPPLPPPVGTSAAQTPRGGGDGDAPPQAQDGDNSDSNGGGSSTDDTVVIAVCVVAAAAVLIACIAAAAYVLRRKRARKPTASKADLELNKSLSSNEHDDAHKPSAAQQIASRSASPQPLAAPSTHDPPTGSADRASCQAAAGASVVRQGTLTSGAEGSSQFADCSLPQRRAPAEAGLGAAGSSMPQHFPSGQQHGNATTASNASSFMQNAYRVPTGPQLQAAAAPAQSTAEPVNQPTPYSLRAEGYPSDEPSSEQGHAQRSSSVTRLNKAEKGPVAASTATRSVDLQRRAAALAAAAGNNASVAAERGPATSDAAPADSQYNNAGSFVEGMPQQQSGDEVSQLFLRAQARHTLDATNFTQTAACSTWAVVEPGKAEHLARVLQRARLQLCRCLLPPVASQGNDLRHLCDHACLSLACGALAACQCILSCKECGQVIVRVLIVQ